MIKKIFKRIGEVKIYFFTVLFALVWIPIVFISPFTRQLDYGWDHFIVNLPKKLSLFDFTSREYSSTFLFGKYINKRASDKVTIAAIDDATVQKYGYPFKRRHYGTIIDKLKALGVKAIGVDVMFFEPDRDDPSNDRIFAEAVARAGNVVNLVGIDQDVWTITGTQPGLRRNSAYLAYPNVDMTKDDDGQVRRYWPFYPGRDLDEDYQPDEFLTYAKAGLKDIRCWKNCKDATIPSLGIAPYAVYSGKPLLELEMRYGAEARYLSYRYKVARPVRPGRKNSEQLTRESAFRHISVLDIMEGTLAPEEKAALKDGITFIGSTALGAFDHVPSPFDKQLPGVEVHATFLDNLMAGDFKTMVDSLYLSLLMLLLPLVPVTLRKQSLSLQISVSGAIMFGLFVTDIVLRANAMIMPFMSVFLVFFLPAAYITVDRGLAEGREKRWIKTTFGQYLSPKVVDLITKDPSKLSLGGEKRDMTAFFLDLAGFTTMSEKLSPEELTAMLVEYLSAFTDVILKHDGTVDKYIGDCIMAFWNAPLDQADHRKLGILTAIDCQAEMTRLNETLTQFAIKPKCRVGVNSGHMVVGNMGSKSRLSYTVMGDTVNMASRMEGANKYFHSKIMTSEATFGDLKDSFDYRYLGSIRVVGKAIPTKVYEPFARKGEAPADVKAMLGHYEAGIEKFYKSDFAGSLPHFKAALAALPGDGPSQFYVQNAELFSKEPPKDWDQSFNLTEKG